ncbi:5'-AMP-activated protein kinase subunit gamma-2-like [Coregonus clupeaformis]|uniref:5'-AMP-activated protein kinase subunit gamma-2-like n=1 Tax=Coregonus clupeaformis TaxID=59861 RepID=UPI001E1C943F|nr:5'-AMP-activated protein kinase subunit gamma-2-like [Coregonus clupeaformis]
MGSTANDSKKRDVKKTPRKKRTLRLNMPDLGSFAMPFLEGDADHVDKADIQKGDGSCHSASPTKGFFTRGPFSRPSSPKSAPARTKNSPGSPKTIFPYPSSHQDSPPKSPRRLSFSGIFRSSSRDSNSTSTSPVSIKLFSRARKGKTSCSMSNRVGSVNHAHMLCKPLDRHPERRVKAAFAAYEELNMPLLKKENPNMWLSQLKQQLKNEWMKSPENPLNQRFANYNAK